MLFEINHRNTTVDLQNSRAPSTSTSLLSSRGNRKGGKQFPAANLYTIRTKYVRFPMSRGRRGSVFLGWIVSFLSRVLLPGERAWPRRHPSSLSLPHSAQNGYRITSVNYWFPSQTSTYMSVTAFHFFYVGQDGSATTILVPLNKIVWNVLLNEWFKKKNLIFYPSNRRDNQTGQFFVYIVIIVLTAGVIFNKYPSK